MKKAAKERDVFPHTIRSRRGNSRGFYHSVRGADPATSWRIMVTVTLAAIVASPNINREQASNRTFFDLPIIPSLSFGEELEPLILTVKPLSRLSRSS